MAEPASSISEPAAAPVSFETHPSRYRHWRLSVNGRIATLTMDVDEEGGIRPDYRLKLNSYDLGVDIELYDALQRIRFEHPQVAAVILASGKERVFCSGANIFMLGSSSHAWKVNFCKFTNETRNGMEDSSAHCGIKFIAACSGTTAGGGYELALACDEIVLVDDRSSAVSLPEVPLLGVLPGTGGLTRLTDKRRVRRDLADVFCTTVEGVRGQRAREWRLVDEVVTPSGWDAAVRARAEAFAAKSDRPDCAPITLTPLRREFTPDGVRYDHVRIAFDRAARTATLTLRAPDAIPPDLTGIHAQGAEFWALAAARELDDALLHLRCNEPELGLLLLRTEGDPQAVLACDALLDAYSSDWLVREIRLYWKRVLKRLDMTSRSLIALIEPGSCFAGTLAELAWAADRAVMRDVATMALSPANFGLYPMGNGLTRLRTRFWGEPESVDRARAWIGATLDAKAADALGLVTAVHDDIDWDDEVRMLLEERASAAGEAGALKKYGTGLKPEYDRNRV